MVRRAVERIRYYKTYAELLQTQIIDNLTASAPSTFFDKLEYWRANLLVLEAVKDQVTGFDEQAITAVLFDQGCK